MIFMANVELEGMGGGREDEERTRGKPGEVVNLTSMSALRKKVRVGELRLGHTHRLTCGQD